MFFRECALAYPIPQFTDLWLSDVVTSTIILRNVAENQHGIAGMPDPEKLSLAPLLRKKQTVQLPWPSRLGQCQQGPLAME